jgi:hypothetical protein
MSVTVEGSGTQTAVVGTEHILLTTAGAKEFQAIVDLANMVNGDALEIRVRTKALSGGGFRVAFYGTYQHDQGDIVAVTPSIASPYGWEVAIKQTAGTGRAFDWNVASVDTGGGGGGGDVTSINGDAGAAARLAAGTNTEVLVTIAAGSTGTILQTTCDPAATVADQFKSRLLLFRRSTATAALRSKAATILGSGTDGSLTVAGLSPVPSAGDLAVIV